MRIPRRSHRDPSGIPPTTCGISHSDPRDTLGSIPPSWWDSGGISAAKSFRSWDRAKTCEQCLGIRCPIVASASRLDCGLLGNIESTRRRGGLDALYFSWPWQGRLHGGNIPGRKDVVAGGGNSLLVPC